jgi:hypothetical protein
VVELHCLHSLVKNSSKPLFCNKGMARGTHLVGRMLQMH